MPRFDRLELEQQAGGPPTPSGFPAEPRDEQYWLRIADGERRQGQHENALRFYSRALEQDKALIAGWLGQVQMLVMLGEYPEADMWAVKALELFKNQPELLAARAQALVRRGDLSAARAICDGAFAQPGQSAYRWIVRGEMILANHQDMDRYCFDKAIHVNPDWLVPLEIAAVYAHHGQPGKAIIYQKKALALCPDNAHAWFGQAVLEDELAMTDAARRSVRRSLDLCPHHTGANELETRLDQGWRPLRWLRRLWQSD